LKTEIQSSSFKSSSFFAKYCISVEIKVLLHHKHLSLLRALESMNANPTPVKNSTLEG